MSVTIMYKKGNTWYQAANEKGVYEVNFLIAALDLTHDVDRIFYINPEENSISIYKNGKTLLLRSIIKFMKIKSGIITLTTTKR